MNDIVAEFASSYYKDEFDQVALKQYHVVAGSVFSDEYNETLDSAVIVLDHIKKEDRLFVEPYQYVHTFDINNKANFDRLYLVDSFSEQEKNIHKNFFSYTINLMSETKLLEKIQCPNLTITHRVKQGATERLTIFEHIRRYIELYSPVIKKGSVTIYPPYTTWGYERIIRLPTVGTTNYEKFYNKFNVPCADLAFSMPTLRQVLTTLMQQVGCIPTLHGGELGFLDLRADPESFGPDFTADYSVSRIQRSLSSDSYANTLVNISSNVLDSNNKVVSEHLGFRDRSNILLKQTENLYLQTKFPIYKVTKFVINCFGTYSNVANVVTTNLYRTGHDDVVYGTATLNASISIDTNQAQISIPFTWIKNTSHLDLTAIQYKIKLLGYANNTKIVEYDSDYASGYYSSPTAVNNTVTYVFSNIGSASLSMVTHWCVYLQIDELIDEDHAQSTALDSECYNLVYYDANGDRVAPPVNGSVYYMSEDITPLLLENSIRQNLKTNFKTMTTANTLEELATYIYGTIGYSIGSNTISGFSNTYSYAYPAIFGPVTVTKTYIENITDFIFKHISKEDMFEQVYEHSGLLITDRMFTPNTKITTNDLSGFVSFVPITFDIEYQPLNSFNMAFSKKDKDIPLAIEQLDTNESGLTDFDRLALKEQETVDRIGNVVLSISQRAKNLEDIRGNADGKFSLTYFRDDTHRDGHLGEEKYIIFKRQIAVNDYYYDVSYTGMENAILKDYFTSIRTKYRAYEYVDYNSSVLRKERDVIYVRLGLDYVYNGSDNIHFPWNDNAKNFIDGFTLYDHHVTSRDETSEKLYSKNIEYICEAGIGTNITKNGNMPTIIKNDLSIISTSNDLVFIYENDDNAGAGTYIQNPRYDTYYTKSSEESEAEYEERVKLGGVPQAWQIWEDSYAVSHPVLIVGAMDFAPQIDAPSFNNNVLTSLFGNNALLPIISEATNIGGTNYESVWDSTDDKSKKFTIGKKTITDSDISSLTGASYERLFYKDYSERINHTVQFDYYTLNPENIAWTELFIENSSLVQKSEVVPNCLICVPENSEDDIDINKLSKEFYVPDPVTNKPFTSDTQIIADNYETVYTQYVALTTNDGVPCINVAWHNFKTIIVAYRQLFTDAGNYYAYKDFIAFHRPDNEETLSHFYISFNDTKSEYVFDRSEDGVLYKKGKVKTNVNSRQYEDL